MMEMTAALFSSRVKAQVLRLLFGLRPAELHVREIARRAGLNDATVRQELGRLKGAGLLSFRRDGNRALYRANSSHPLYPDLRNIVLKTAGLADVLREVLGPPEVRIAFVFGSVAAGTESPESDLDLMVIGRSSLRKIASKLAGASARLGREVNPHVLTPAEVLRRKRTRDPFLTGVLASPKIFVVGDDHELGALGC
jgi:DNA-binding transcriptional ArsR family regulator